MKLGNPPYSISYGSPEKIYLDPPLAVAPLFMILKAAEIVNR